MNDEQDLPDLFAGFDSRFVETGEARIFCRIGGEGPPLVLLHGYPQTHVIWHKVAGALAEHFTLVIPDLRGYGWSSLPEEADDHATMSKRAMARDIVAVMEKLGYARFAIAGHDRGGRVAYRLALDHPGRVTKIAVLDIIPTLAQWQAFDWREALKTYHWAFLAQPHPLPETLIVPSAVAYLEATLASWTAGRSLDAFDAGALAHYRAAYDVPERVHALCEDYRAGASYDMRADALDREQDRRISAPLLALWGQAGIPAGASGGTVLEVWRQWADEARGQALDCGHFLPEEAPEACARALLDFFA